MLLRLVVFLRLLVFFVFGLINPQALVVTEENTTVSYNADLGLRTIKEHLGPPLQHSCALKMRLHRQIL